MFDVERKKLPNPGSNSWSSLSGSYPLTIRLLGKICNSLMVRGKVPNSLMVRGKVPNSLMVRGMKKEVKINQLISF